ncbi:MAG TPA: hypothetical protein VG056_02440, partial [Pirellulales bacterium]|nr:hypothetical protein [Pirellulales bacterium]
MQTELPNRKRRFQFSLRTLLIGVTLLAVLCAYVAREVKIAKERRKAVETYEPLREIVKTVWRGGNEYESRDVLIEAPWPLRWFGEDGYKGVVVPDNTAADEIVRLERLFPEASVVRRSDTDYWNPSPQNRPTHFSPT